MSREFMVSIEEEVDTTSLKKYVQDVSSAEEVAHLLDISTDHLKNVIYKVKLISVKKALRLAQISKGAINPASLRPDIFGHAYFNQSGNQRRLVVENA